MERITVEQLIEKIRTEERANKFYPLPSADFLHKIIYKMKEGFFPATISMNNEGKVMLNGAVASPDDIDQAVLKWFVYAKHCYPECITIPFAVVGAVNDMYKKYEIIWGD